MAKILTLQHILILVISIRASLIRASSLCHNFDDLHTLLARMNVKFNIIGITETTLKFTVLEI